tara:strand:- start:769 stop:963 length:195 start_codon:yes stop_codon:yes gene_type:complete
MTTFRERDETIRREQQKIPVFSRPVRKLACRKLAGSIFAECRARPLALGIAPEGCLRRRFGSVI